MLRSALGVEVADLEPAEVHRKAGRPDDRDDASLLQVERQHRIGDALRQGTEHLGLRLFRQVQTFALNIVISLVEQCEIIAVTCCDIAFQVVVERQRAIGKGASAAKQRDALRGKIAEIHGVAAIGATDRDGHVLHGRVWRFHVPLAQLAQPPDEILAPVAARRTVMRTDGQIDLAPGPNQFLGNLCA